MNKSQEIINLVLEDKTKKSFKVDGGLVSGVLFLPKDNSAKAAKNLYAQWKRAASKLGEIEQGTSLVVDGKVQGGFSGRGTFGVAWGVILANPTGDFKTHSSMIGTLISSRMGTGLPDSVEDAAEAEARKKLGIPDGVTPAKGDFMD